MECARAAARCRVARQRGANLAPPTRCRCGPSASARRSRAAAGRTASWSRTPATPACGPATMIELKHPTQRYFRCAGSLGWGLPGRARREMRAAGPAGRLLHRRRRPPLPHRRARDGGAPQHQPVIVVNNNSSLNQEITSQQHRLQRQAARRRRRCGAFPHLNFAKIAEDFGCAGIRVEHPGELGRRDEERDRDEPAGRGRRRHRHVRDRAASWTSTGPGLPLVSEDGRLA